MKQAFKKIFNYKFHTKVFLNPFINFQKKNLGVNKDGRDLPVIISLTSYQDRFKCLPKTLYSLFNQDLKADRVILWVDKNSIIPKCVKSFEKYGLEIKYVEDIRSYTKIIYALEKYSSTSVIVTADDDIYYPKNWLELLYQSYLEHPEDIHVHRAHRVLYDNGKILPYESWLKHVKEESARFDNFITGVGGALYPPNCFGKEVLNREVFLKNSPTADDVWLWVMSLYYKRKVRVVKNHIKTLTCTDLFLQLGFGKTLYAENKLGNNDKQLKNLLEIYNEVII